ncbi:MAG: carboxypeptidase-like regulatory domain-containing protein [Acidobacteriia bacterium]|nr:carboxypeptidase-like regulatory domain-containing protein [Terriglobia bacterium]
MKKTNRHFPQSRTLLLLATLLAGTLWGGSSNLCAKEKNPGKEKEPKSADYALIKGSVFREDGFSVRGARVSCRRASDAKPRWETVSGDGGEFAFRVPAGKMQYLITAELGGFQSASKTVDIAKDERQDISIVLNTRKP